MSDTPWFDLSEPLRKRLKVAYTMKGSFLHDTEGCRALHDLLVKLTTRIDDGNEIIRKLEAENTALKKAAATKDLKKRWRIFQ